MVVIPPVERWAPIQWILALPEFENSAVIVRPTGANVLHNGAALDGPWSALSDTPFETRVLGTAALSEINRLEGRCEAGPCGILILLSGTAAESGYALTAPPIPSVSAVCDGDE